MFVPVLTFLGNIKNSYYTCVCVYLIENWLLYSLEQCTAKTAQFPIYDFFIAPCPMGSGIPVPVRPQLQLLNVFLLASIVIDRDNKLNKATLMEGSERDQRPRYIICTCFT